MFGPFTTREAAVNDNTKWMTASYPKMSYNAFETMARADPNIFTYRRKTMQEMWRKVAGLFKYEVALKALRPETIIPEAWRATSIWDRSRKYTTVGKYQWMNPATGKYEDKFVGVSHEKMLTKGQALEIMRDMLDPETGESPTEYEELEIMVGEKIR